MRKRMRGILLAALCLYPVLAQTADAPPVVDIAALEYRRTLFAAAGQQSLSLEAPGNMCFLDTSYHAEQRVFDAVAAMTRAVDDSVLIGVFVPCLHISGIGSGGDMPVYGAVSWLNPALGENTPLSRADFLEMQRLNMPAAFARRLARAEKRGRGALSMPKAEDYVVESGATLTPSSASIGFTVPFQREYEDYETTGVIATTAVKDLPVSVSFTATRKAADESAPQHDISGIRALLDKFLAQQIALNE